MVIVGQIFDLNEWKFFEFPNSFSMAICSFQISDVTNRSPRLSADALKARRRTRFNPPLSESHRRSNAFVPVVRYEVDENNRTVVSKVGDMPSLLE